MDSDIKTTVLVADDNIDAAFTLSELLAVLGHSVECAADGREALEIATRVRPRLVFLDIGMPEIDGREVCRRIRATEWGAGSWIVAISGYGTPEDKAASKAAGFDTHCTKPISLATLQEALTHVPH